MGRLDEIHCLGMKVIQNNEMDRVAKMLGPVVKKAGAIMKQYKTKGQLEKYWFDYQCRTEIKLVREAPRAFRNRNDDDSGTKYWKRRVRYGSLLEDEREKWLNKEEVKLSHMAKEKGTEC
jgi:hypothetical protein